jgi:glutamate dehydrogenase
MPPRPELASEAEAAAALLTWLDGHFTFLGYREYDYTHDAEHSTLEPIEHTSTGHLRPCAPSPQSPLSRAVADEGPRTARAGADEGELPLPRHPLRPSWTTSA